MDPLAHTLVGATLAQTRLKNATPLAAATLLIGANLPDIDAVAMFLGSDAALYYRRGLTHGVVALILLPWLLTGALMLYDRWVRLKRDPQKTPVKPWGLLALSYVGVLSHPFLDWLNTYGIRLLMPFDGRWFYGDALYIVDPWLWLLMAIGSVLTCTYTRSSQLLWILLAFLTSALLFTSPEAPAAAKLVWALGVVAIFLTRFRKIQLPSRGASLCLAALAFYLTLIFAGNFQAKKLTARWLQQHFGAEPQEVMTGPLPAQPFRRQVLAVAGSHYHSFEISLISQKIQPLYEPVKVQEPGPVVKKALLNPDIRGFAGWMRFPHYEVIEEGEGHWVTIRDLRYVSPSASGPLGFGMVRVWVGAERP